MSNNEFKHSGYSLLLIKMTIVDLEGRECVVGKSIKVIWLTNYASLHAGLSN